MKVTISVGGKFHAFHLAEGLDKIGYLERIFTSYPWHRVKDSGIGRNKVECLILKEILQRGVAKLPYLGQKEEIPYYLANLFDRQVARRIQPCDIFVGWSGFSLKTLEKIKKTFPAKTIVERGSSHIVFQRDILLEEQDRIGVKIDLPPPEFVEKELAEYRTADYISLPSSFARDTFVARGVPENKLIQTCLGVDTNAFRPMAKNDDTFRIICVGVKIRKGVHYVLQAVDELKIKGIEVWFIGQIGDDIEYFLKRYSGNFRFLGNIPNKELYKYYSQGSVFLLPSLEEGLSLALLEAMACGLPVVCSENTGAKEVLEGGRGGFIVPIRDVEGIKEKISYLYGHPESCRQMGREARLRVESEYTWEKYVGRIVGLYKNITMQGQG